MRHAALEFIGRRPRAVFSLLLFLAALALMAMLGSEHRFRTDAGELGPYFWPQCWLGVLLVLTALDVVVDLRAPRTPAQAAARPPEDLWLAVAATVFVVTYAFAMLLAGFALATAAFCAAFAVLGGYRKMRVLVPLSLITAIALLYLFAKIVYISLPLGAGPFLAINVGLYRLVGIF